MALEIGDAAATSGMTKAVYEALDALLAPAIERDHLEDARKGWRQLAYAVAKGVVDHLTAKLEVTGVQVSGTVPVTLTGTVTGTAVTCSGSVSLSLSQPSTNAGHAR